jgi:hypothetical protein
MSILLKMIYRLNIIPTKTSMAFFTEIGKNPQIHKEPQRFLMAKAVFKKNKTMLPDSKL